MRITAERFAAGLDTKVEVKQAEAALATVRTELAQYDDAIAVARNQIAALVGAGPAARRRHRRRRPHRARRSRALPAAIPLDLVGAPSRDRRVALARRGLARRTSRSPRRMFYPNVNLVGVRRALVARPVEPPVGGSAIAGVGPAIHLPIFEGGRLNANLRGREADADLAVSDVQPGGDRRGARRRRRASRRSTASPRVATEQARARAATTDAYNLAVIRYRAGLGNYLTVLTAQTQQLVQDRLDADLKARAFELDVNLARALGGGYVDPACRPLLSAAPR